MFLLMTAPGLAASIVMLTAGAANAEAAANMPTPNAVCLMNFMVVPLLSLLSLEYCYKAAVRFHGHRRLASDFLLSECALRVTVLDQHAAATADERQVQLHGLVAGLRIDAGDIPRIAGLARYDDMAARHAVYKPHVV